MFKFVPPPAAASFVVMLFVSGISGGLLQSALAAEFRVDPHLDTNLISQYYPQAISSTTNTDFEILHLEVPTSLQWGTALGIKVRPEVQLDPLNLSQSERYWIEFPEAYLQLKPIEGGSSLLTAQIGLNTFTWGVTDVFNPLDIVNTRRYEDPLATDKLGAPSILLHTELPGGVISMEGVYIPLQRQAILPGVNSRWLPRNSFQSQSVQYDGVAATILPPSSVDFAYTDPQVLDNALNNNVGARIEAHLPSLDLALIFFDGAAGMPATDLQLSGAVIEVDPNVVIAADPNIGITPVYYRQLVGGGNFTYALGDFIFRGEAALTRVVSQRSDLPTLTNEFAAEIEHDFSLGDDPLTTFLEVTYAQHSEAIDPSLASLGRIFDRAVLLGLRYARAAGFSVSALGMLDTAYHGQLAHLEIAYPLSDSIKPSLSGDLILGPTGTPLGTYQQNDRITFTLKYSI